MGEFIVYLWVRYVATRWNIKIMKLEILVARDNLRYSMWRLLFS